MTFFMDKKDKRKIMSKSKSPIIDFGKCSVKDCSLKACSFIRGKEVCWDCFDRFKSDNIMRFKLGKSIPLSFEILEYEEK